MPNLVITNTCNLRCPFCFASEYRADAGERAAARMTIEEFARPTKQVDPMITIEASAKLPREAAPCYSMFLPPDTSASCP